MPRLFIDYFRLLLLIMLSHFFFVKLNLNSCHSTFLFDFFTKTTLNDPCVAYFHLYWINLSYLPIVFTSLVFISMLILRNVTPFTLSVVTFVFYFYVVELEDFVLFNSSVLFSNPQSLLFNNLLTNLLNKYHPAVFYLSVVFFILNVWGDEGSYSFKLKRSSTKTQHLFNRWWGVILQLNLVALTLGSWWALQEGTWGGWWNWDPSETLGLLVSFSVLLLLHLNVTKSTVCFWLLTRRLTYYFFLCSYFFIQLNFEIVSHNFNFKLFHFFNSNVTLIQLLLCMLMLMLLCLNKLIVHLSLAYYVLFRHRVTLLRQDNLKVYLTCSSFLFFLSFPFISYLPIINYFTWNFFNITLFYQTQPLGLLNFFIIVYLLSQFVRLTTPNTLLTAFYTFTTSNFTYVYVYFVRSGTSASHLLLTTFLLLSFTAVYVNYLIWEYGTTPPNPVSLDSFLTEKHQSFIVQDGTVERVLQWYDVRYIIVGTWNISGLSNSFEISDFLLLLSHSTLVNFYYISLDWCYNNMFIEIHNINSLVLLTVLLCLNFLYTWKVTNRLTQTSTLQVHKY